ncbi:hypothetical protein EV363DRAFT_1386193 [Boletus edulis]|nr:hypothetical protein EV363DRAFT_1386193 [Boletus edulis]
MTRWRYTQKVLWLPKIGAQFTLGRNAIPEPSPGEARVTLKASALNHMDDGAGVVLNVGDGVRNLARGDNVLFQATFNNKYGSFQEYCVVLAEIAIPPNLSYEEAASILIAFAPFAVATYAQRPQGIALTPPFEEGGLGKYAGRPIVIFGGAASVGQQAIQLATLSGFSPIITTASLHHEDLLLSLGATHVIDRKLPNGALIKRVRELVVAPLGYIFDAVSVKDTQHAGYALLAPGGTLAVVGPPQVGREDDGSGKKVIMVLGSFHLPPNRALGATFAIALTRWLQEGKIKSNRVEVVPGGLNGVVPGLRQLARGVSATKLVVCPPETIYV